MADQNNHAGNTKADAQTSLPKASAAAEPAKATEAAKTAAPKAETPKTEVPKPAAVTPRAVEAAKSAPAKAKPAKAPAARAKNKAVKAKTAAKPKAAAVKRKPAGRPTEARKPAMAKAAARTIQNNVNEGRSIMNKQTKKAVETGAFAADQFQAVFGEVNERAKNAAERSARVVEELTDLTRGNVEALIASSKVAARAAETLSQEAADYSRRSFEEASATLKSFAEVKSPTDLFRLQSEYARSAFDSAVAESSKISEAMLKIAGEVAQPITSRYSVAAERVKNLAA
jgi:phasin family protein